MAVDGGEGRLGAGIGAEDGGGAHRHRAEQAGTGEGKIVSGRQHSQIDVIAGEPAEFGAGRRVEHVIVVGAGDELGCARGPAGNQKQRRRSRVSRGRRAGRLLAQLRPRGERPRVAVDDDVPQRWVFLDEAERHRAIVETRRGIGDQQTGGRADRGEMPKLGGPVSRQAHHRDRPARNNPNKATANWQLFGNCSSTRSPGAIPSARSPPEARLAWSSRSA